MNLIPDTIEIMPGEFTYMTPREILVCLDRIADIDDTGLIYLASPYSDADPHVRQQRFDRVYSRTARLIKAGVKVFSPIVYSHPMSISFDIPNGWAFWQEHNDEWLEKCEELWIYCLPGWDESNGVRHELAYANKLGMPVKYLRFVAEE